MTRLPRDVDGATLVRALSRLGYEVARQSGSHVRLTTQDGGRHHVTVPAHSPLRIGTLSAILSEVAIHLGKSRDDLIEQLFG